jgi:hypothetical protein
VAALVQSQVKPRGICDGRTGTAKISVSAATSHPTSFQNDMISSYLDFGTMSKFHRRNYSVAIRVLSILVNIDVRAVILY